MGAVIRIRNVLSYATHRFFQEKGFLYIHTPIITASDCEGAGEMFQITTLDVNRPPRTSEEKSIINKIFSAKKPTSRFQDSLMVRFMRARFLIFIPLGPTFRAEILTLLAT